MLTDAGNSSTTVALPHFFTNHSLTHSLPAQVIELKEENQETQSLQEMVDLMRGQLEKEYAMRTKAEKVR